MKEQGSGLPITLIEGQSREAMQAADMVLMASGTTTLEALLLKKPMVVAYKLSPFTFAVAKMLVKLDYFSLPNLLAGEQLVPEVLQKDVRPEMLGPLVLQALNLKESERHKLMSRFQAIHQQLKQNASERAADVLLKMINARRG